MTCLADECGAEASSLLRVPLCGKHARQVYQDVCDALGNASAAQLAQAVGPSRGRAKPLLKTTQGTVYFMRFGTLIKIGWTSNLPSRVRSLGPDKVLATQPGTMQDEKALHARFGPAWSHGEYFHPSDDLRAYIGSLG